MHSLRKTYLLGYTLLLVTFFIFLANNAHAQVRAFPTAEGYGQYAKGGRGGAIFEVTTLANAGPGSLRECLEASGARTCVFKVSGVIEITDSIKVYNPYLTIAGQTSPDGIIVKAGPNLKTTPIYIYAPHIIIRNIQFLPGRGGVTGGAANALDALGVFPPAHDIIIDHVTFAWGADEGLNVYAPNTTVQWSTISETLKNHSKGSVMWGNSQTYHHNLTAHNSLRNPDFTGGKIDWINNVMYNGGQRNAEFYNRRENLSLNFVGNYGVKGKNTDSKIVNMDFFGYESTAVNNISFYMEGNIDWYRTSNSMAEDEGVDPADKKWLAKSVRNGGLSVDSSNITDAKQAALDTLAFAGVNVPRRSSLDVRVTNDVRNCTGGHIFEPSEVGGYPSINSTLKAPTDSDKDGMPDSWEIAQGLNAGNAADRNFDTDTDGYTNVEEYLNELAGDQDSSGKILSKIGKGTGSLPASPSCGLTTPAKAPTSPVIEFSGSGGGITSSKFFTVSPGTPVTVSWTATNAQRCTLGISSSAGAVKPVIGLTGTYTYTPTGATNFKIACANGNLISNEAVAVALTNNPYFADGAQSAPVITFTSSAKNITSGESTTLSWSATGAETCVPVNLPYTAGKGISQWSTNNNVSGSAQVSPTMTTEYGISCMDKEGQATAFTTVTVGAGVPAPAPNPTFTPGTAVVSTAMVNVRERAGLSASIVGKQIAGSAGTVLATTPVIIDGFTWFPIDFATGVDGWVAGDYLVKSVSTTPPQVTLPAVSLTLSPSTIKSGNAATLTWTSVNAITCSAVNFSTEGALSGSLSVNPAVNTTYSLTCSNSAGSDSKSTILTVNPLVAPTSTAPNTPPPTPPTTTTTSTTSSSSTATLIGSMIVLSERFSVRDRVGGTNIGLQNKDAKGVIIAGPVKTSGGTWWNVNFDSGSDGWVREDYFIVVLPPKVTLEAQPTSIGAGESFKLQWVSVNANTCAAGGTGWSGAKATAGNETLSPVVSSVYSITCQGAGGTADDTASVEVTQPPSPSPSQTIEVGTNIVLNERYGVRNKAGGTNIGLQNKDAKGVIIAGPVKTSGGTWWNVNFDSGSDGWVREDYFTPTGLVLGASTSLLENQVFLLKEIVRLLAR